MPTDTKKCARCGEEKDRATQFGKYRKGKGVSSQCNACGVERLRAWQVANPEAVRAGDKLWADDNRELLAEYSKQYYSDNKVSIRTKAREKKYNLPPGGLAQLLANQLNECAFLNCHVALDHDTAQVDHDHSCCNGNRSCGKCTRGLLCGHHNSGLGFFHDNPEELRDAIAYLAAHNAG